MAFLLIKTPTTPVECVYRSTGSTPFPYNDEDFLADNTCCTGSNTIKAAGETCYLKDSYGSYKSFNLDKYKTEHEQNIIDEIDTYGTNLIDTLGLLSTPSNDIIKRSFERKCEGSRGNICAGDINDKFTLYENCLPDKQPGDIATCSGPLKDLLKSNSEVRFPPPTQGAYCEAYDGTTFEKEAGLTTDIKCNNQAKCVSDPTSATGFLDANIDQNTAHYVCDAATCGNGQCSRPILCTDCYGEQTCVGPTQPTPNQGNFITVKEFDALQTCATAECSFMPKRDISDSCDIDNKILTDYMCNPQGIAFSFEKVFTSTEFDCTVYTENGAIDTDGGNNPYEAGTCTAFGAGFCGGDKCNEGDPLAPVSDKGLVQVGTSLKYLEYYAVGNDCIESYTDYDDLDETRCTTPLYGDSSWGWSNGECCGDDAGESWDGTTCVLS